MGYQLPLFALLFLGCGNASVTSFDTGISNEISSELPVNQSETDENGWAYFLRHLPVIDQPIVDYRGRLVEDQYKSAGIIPYFIGKADLQQCADALMRLRAEYLFYHDSHNAIGFHFVS